MTLEQAIHRLFNFHHIDDYIYDQRDKAREHDGYEGEDSWGSFRVKSFNACLDTLQRHIKTKEK